MIKAGLVTGGSSGIGLAIARMLRAEGFELTLASRTKEKIERAAGELGAHPVPADVSEEDDCERLVTEHRERFGRLDILVNNAGMSIRKPPQDYAIEEWRQVLDTNLTGALACCQASYPLMQAQGRGKISISARCSRYSAPPTPPRIRPARARWCN